MIIKLITESGFKWRQQSSRHTLVRLAFLLRRVSSCKMENQLLWQPRTNRSTNLDEFRRIVNKKYLLNLQSYSDLYKWSVKDFDLFWKEVWHYTRIVSSVSYEEVIDKNIRMNDIPEWFRGARLNFAQNLLRDRSSNIAIYAARENQGCIEKRTFSSLYNRVALYASALKKLGLRKGNVVAGYVPNCCEAVEAMLATASIGAIWTSASMEFGVKGVLDRFTQVQPYILFSCDHVVYNGKKHNQLEKLSQIVTLLPSLHAVIIINYEENDDLLEIDSVSKSMSLEKFLQIGKNNDGTIPNLIYEQLPFNHPLFIMYSSGTTGAPKCMVHSAGGTLIKHLEEHVLQANLNERDVILFFTTTGWMMWNWLVSCLALGCSIVLYDGSPLYPNAMALWDLIDELRITVLGTGAKWLALMEANNIQPKTGYNLSSLHTIFSTGSPLSPHSFDYVYSHVKSDLALASITGGTDIIGCFAGINASAPVYRGEIQSRYLGMAVESWNVDGEPVEDESGELVCVKPFPSMPTEFWDDKNRLKYFNAYFNKYPGIWCHGDYCIINSKTGGIIMLGRSDGTLNPGGIRFGSADIYNIVEQFKEVQDSLCVAQLNLDGEERVILFLKMTTGLSLTQELVNSIKAAVRHELSPRHVPALILEIRDIPYTTNGKKVEVAVKQIISGKDVVNKSALINPDSLELFRNIKELRSW